MPALQKASLGQLRLFGYTGPSESHPFCVVHLLLGFMALYRPRSSLSLPLGFSMEGVGVTLFVAPFQLPAYLARLEVLPIPFSLPLLLFEQLGGG